MEIKIAFVGSSHALHEKFKDYPQIENWGINGLPIWDIELKKKIEEVISKDFAKIYISCGHPFMGCAKKKDILKLSKNSFLSFQQKQRGFFGKTEFTKISLQEASDLCEKYIQYLRILAEKDPRIKIIPLTILWHEKIRESQINIPSIYDRIKQDFDILDASLVLNSKFDFVNKFGKLHPKSMEKIISIL